MRGALGEVAGAVGAAREPGSEREAAHLVLPLAVAAAQDENEEILNGTPYRHALADRKHSRHGETLAYALIGIGRHGLEVLGEQNPALRRSPLQDHRISRSPKTKLLNAHEVKAGFNPKDAIGDSSVKAFIGEQAQHYGVGLESARRASSRSRTPSGGKSASICLQNASASRWRCSR